MKGEIAALSVLLISVLVSGCTTQEGQISAGTEIKDCLADNDCFEKALETCEWAEYAYCLPSLGCEKASVLGERDGYCEIRNWAEDSGGKVFNYDKTCLVTKGYEIGESERFASRICR